MRIRIICIVICSLFLTTITLQAEEIKTNDSFTIDNLITNNEKILNRADVPIWTQGTVWTYKINDINFDYTDNASGIVFHLHFSTDNFPVKVVSTSGSSYQISFDAKMSGDVYIETDESYFSIKAEGNLRNTKLKGDIYFRKSDLAIQRITMQFSTKVALFISQPIRLPALRASADLEFNLGFSNPYTILIFPIETGISWGLPATGIFIDGSIKSPWLHIANVVNIMLRLSGLIPDEYREISDLIEQILPVIDISDTLNLFDIPNPMDIPEMPNVFNCSDRQNITVPAGSYDTYNISVFNEAANIYYAPDVGTIIKITGNLKNFIPFLENINLELVNDGALSIKGGFGVSAVITNTGTDVVTDLPWSINVSGGIILSGDHTEGTIDELAVGASTTIKSKGLRGIGPIIITVQAGDVTKEATAFLLGPLVLRVTQ